MCEGCGRQWPCDPSMHKSLPGVRELAQHWYEAAGSPPFCGWCRKRSPCDAADEHAALRAEHDRKQAERAAKEAARRKTEEMRKEFASVRTPALLLKLYLRQDGKCSACDEPVDLDDSDKDRKPSVLHDIALAREGTNDETNLSLGHAICNRRQGTRRLSEIRAIIAAENATAKYRAVLQRSISILEAAETA